MLIAETKRKENIAEYVIYMWQLEDLMRASNFKASAFQENIKAQAGSNMRVETSIKEWYELLAKTMKSEEVEKKGHVSELNELMVELFYLHTSLLNIFNDAKYKLLSENSEKYLEEFAKRSNASTNNPVELCFNGLYAKFLLRVQKKSISPATEEAFNAFRDLLSYLSLQYKKMKNGELTQNQN